MCLLHRLGKKCDRKPQFESMMMIELVNLSSACIASDANVLLSGVE